MLNIEGKEFDTKAYIQQLKAAYQEDGKQPYTINQRYNVIYDTFFLILYAFLLLCTLSSLLSVWRNTTDIKSEGYYE